MLKENNYIKAWDKKLIHKNLKNIRIPESTIEAYKLQADYKTYSKHNLFGWKIAATSIEGQKHIGVDGPIAGRLIKERLHRSGDRISLKNNQMKVVEAEFSFKLNKDMQKKNTPYLYEEVLEYIEHICPAIEIPDSRFLNFNKIGKNLLIADNACAGEYVLGKEPTKSWKHINLKTFKVGCYKNNHLIGHGIGSNVLEDPIKALTWLINELNKYNITLYSGQTVLTGTCIKPIEVLGGDHIVIDFYELGKVDCHFF
jgi:2-keto-4-pentenoate hydratase|tara:strand:+ start:1897 stop:2664 length:768 start_codon:yes stop_codon:yes gene_type:complete